MSFDVDIQVQLYNIHDESPSPRSEK